ncbi:hypothetical protein DBA29_20380 [Xenophilus aerolatus]|nr:hypothetical protein [Xenophilus aerolatus]
MSKVKAAQEELVSEIAADMLFRIMLRTPVDTGLLQSSFEIQDLTADGFTIVNDTPYALYVEEGTEKMGPAHMVRATLEERQEIVDRAALTIKTRLA